MNDPQVINGIADRPNRHAADVILAKKSPKRYERVRIVRELRLLVVSVVIASFYALF